MDHIDLPPPCRSPESSRLDKINRKMDRIHYHKIRMAVIPGLTRPGIRKNVEIRERELHRERLVILDVVEYAVIIPNTPILVNDKIFRGKRIQLNKILCRNCVEIVHDQLPQHRAIPIRNT